MSESHRDHDKSSNTSLSQNHRNSKDESERPSRKRPYLDTDNIDTKVYIGNLPTEKITDEELLDFFKPFGKVSDIRVFKDHIFVQYNRVDEANKLIVEAQIPLIFKGHKLDVQPARDVRSRSAKSSSTDRSSKRRSDERNLHPPSTRKPFPTRERIGSDKNDSISRNHSLPYSILTGPKNPNEIVDCQIILVNVRQREYAEEIESRLTAHNLLVSIILLREDYTLTDAIENAARLQCLYGVIVMPMHEERRTASFHILHGQTEEHRNLTMEDGIHIIVTNFISYKERRLHSEPSNSYEYSEPMPSYEYLRQSSQLPQEDSNPPVLTLGDKLPLSMLLCLLADGRQLTLEEIDRVLIYLLEKKATMLTLPSGTLPPLPAQYATMPAFNHQSNIMSDTRPASSPGNSTSNSAEVTSTIAEHIRQILSTNNILKSNSSTVDTISPPVLNKPPLDKLSNLVKMENHTNAKETANGYAQHQQKTQSPFTFPKNEVVSPFSAPNFSSYNSMTLNPALKPPTTSIPIPNFVSQAASQYFYSIPAPTVYPSTLNSSAADATAAILQAYSQFNVQPTVTPSILTQQMTTQQPPIRK